jgi:hypothetical protein
MEYISKSPKKLNKGPKYRVFRKQWLPIILKSIENPKEYYKQYAIKK